MAADTFKRTYVRYCLEITLALRVNAPKSICSNVLSSVSKSEKILFVLTIRALTEIIGFCFFSSFFTWHPVSEEILVADKRVALAAVHEGEAGGPIDEGADANIQPVLDQDVHCVLRPEIQLSIFCLFTLIYEVINVIT